MSFINPGALWFLPISLTPLIIHLIFLKMAVEVRFSSIFLLREIYIKNLHNLRINQWILIFLRCLLVALLVFAFSRPVIKSNLLGSFLNVTSDSADVLKVVFLFDTSYSMRKLLHGRQYYESVKKSALKILNTLKNTDKTAVGFFSKEWEGTELEWTGDFSRAAKRIEISNAGFKETDFLPPLKKSYEFLSKEKSGTKIIIVFSDGAKHGFSKFKSAKDLSIMPFYDPGVLLIGLRSDFNRENAWVSDIQVRGMGSLDFLKNSETGNVIINAKCLIKNGFRYDYPARLENLPYIQTKFVDLKDGVPVNLRWNLPQRVEKFQGAVRLKEDELDVDDIYYYSLEGRTKPVRVLVAYKNPLSMKIGCGGYFLKKLLGKEENRNLPFICDFTDFSKLSIGEGQSPFGDSPLKDYSVVIVYGIPDKDSNFLKILKSYLISQGSVWIIPSGADDNPWISLEDFTGVRCENFARMKVFMVQGEETPKSFKKFGFDDFEISKIKIQKFLHINPPSNYKTFWHFADEHGKKYPALVAKNINDSRIMVSAFSMDIAHSDIAAKPVFPNWVLANLIWLSQAQDSLINRDVFIGEVYNGKLNTSLRSKVKIIDPQAKTHQVYSEHGVFKFNLTQKPGIYRWESSNGQSGCFAVNTDRSNQESDLSIGASLPWNTIRSEESDLDFKLLVHGAEIWQLIMICAVMVSFGEFMVARKL
jgi:hypothetical protein